MKKICKVLIMSCILCMISAVFPLFAEEITVDQIIKWNVAAAGGVEKLNEIKSASIEIYNRGRLYLTAYTQGKIMKIVAGEPPIIQSVILANNDDVKRKTFTSDASLTTRDKCVYICMEKLVSGAFTLRNFQENLTYKGIKKLGPETHYIVESEIVGYTVQINIDTESKLIKRMIIEDNSPDASGYKATYDFLPVVESSGLMIPAGWYECDLGAGATARSTQFDLQNFKINPILEKDFFLKMELNMGSVTSEPGSIKGNIIGMQYSSDGGYGYFTLNIQESDLKKASLNENDKVVFKYGDKEVEATIYTSTLNIGSKEAAPGNILFLSLSGSPFYGIVMFGEQFKPFFEKFEPLKEITTLKK